MNETTQDATYTFGTASAEIFLLLAGAFLLGALLCYVLKKAGLCCRKRTHLSTETPTDETMPRFNLPIEPEVASPPRPNKLAPIQEQVYEADLRSLLRGRDSQAEPPPAPRPTSFQSRVQQQTAQQPTRTPVSDHDALDIQDDRVDDLKKLEGIGPRIEKLLNEAGIRSYAKLASMSRDDLKGILDAGGSQFKMHEPKSWPYQAELAAKQNWQRLKEYQEFLISGERNR